MAALTPKARALIEAGRKAYRPQAADRARVEAALRARLGGAALPPQVCAPASGLGRWQVVAGSALGACMIAGVALWKLSSPPVAAPTLPRKAADMAAAPRAADSVPALAAPEPPQPTAAAPAPVQAARARGRVRQDPLSQEISLLARATRSLYAGAAGDALSLLDEHARRFPAGKLSEERRSARAQALCRLGRLVEGRAEQAQLSQRSPAALHAKQVCDAAASDRDRTANRR